MKTQKEIEDAIFTIDTMGKVSNTLLDNDVLASMSHVMLALQWVLNKASGEPFDEELAAMKQFLDYASMELYKRTKANPEKLQEEIVKDILSECKDADDSPPIVAAIGVRIEPQEETDNVYLRRMSRKIRRPRHRHSETVPGKSDGQ